MDNCGYVKKVKSSHSVVVVYIEIYNDFCLNSETGESLPMIKRVPCKPGHAVATCNRIYMNVKWTEPEDDGGADITGYVIKYGDSFTDVDKYDELSIDGNTTNVQFTDQLNEMTFYQFAVAAVNDVGRGEFSEFTDDVNTWLGKYCCNYHVRYCELM